MEDITSVDLYELLGLVCSASTQDVKKAYRKKALKCHPDKNPDNPKAAELFHQLSRALEILTDDSARSAYDKVINAKKAAALRNKELDSKRKKLKEDLEARERQAQFNSCHQKSAEERQLQAEIERLRKEGSKQVEEEIELLRNQVQEEMFCGSSDSIYPTLFRLKISWKISMNDSNNVYNSESLKKIFLKYGEIEALVVSNKKGSALLEFTSPAAALKAQQLEKGFLTNPLTVSWLSGTPPISKRPSEVRSRTPTMPANNQTSRAFPCFPSTPAPDVFTKKRQEKQDEDFESLVLSRMRKAEEEKRATIQKETQAKEDV